MTESDFKTIELALGVKFPGEYRRVMSDKDALANPDFWYGGLFSWPKRVISETVRAREAAASFGAEFREAWVVISVINGGDIVFVDTTEPGSPMRIWNHETLRVEPFTDSVARFVDSIRDEERKRQDG